MKERVRQRHDVRQLQIIQAVGTLITTKGMNSVTIHDIAGEIGVTEAAIYRHFTSKRAIYSLLLERWEESLLSTVRGEQYDSLPALENLERAFWAQLSEVQNRQALSFIVIEAIAFEGMRGLSTQVAAVITDYLEAIQDILVRGINEGTVRPDVNPGMEGLLKAPSKQKGGNGRSAAASQQLFTVFGQPRVSLEGPNADGEYVAKMEGVDIYDPVKNVIVPTKADKVAAWFLDGDYDGRTFCITQAFFPDRSAWEKLAKALKGVIDEDRFAAFSGMESLPFPPGKHGTVAVKVIDPRGNEVMKVMKL